MNSLIREDLLTLSAAQLSVLNPYFWVIGGVLLGIVAAVTRLVSPKWSVFFITVLSIAFAICSSFELFQSGRIELFNNMMVGDRFSHLMNIVFLASALFTVFVSFRYLDREGIQHPEYNLLILFSTIGMMLMASAQDLIVIFIALETMSLAVYSLVGFRRADRRCNEAAVKYFVLGGVASAVLLYGASLLYGVTGSTQLGEILDFARTHGHSLGTLYVIGAGMVLIGFLFKVASVPFHMWMPDVYEGAPAPVTGFMTTGLKAASFATFLRIFISVGFGQEINSVIESQLHNFIWVCAALTMIIGNLVALTQPNLKRMLAYSSIAHTGYLLVGMLSGAQSEMGYSSIVVYLVGYCLMNLGAFIVLTVISGRNDEGLNLADISGLSRHRPWVAFAMAVFMCSMAGIPATVGFIGKYHIFMASIEAHHFVLAVIMVLCSAVSVYYYLRVLVYMYFREPDGSPSTVRLPIWASLSLAAMVIMTIEFGILPARLIEIAQQAVSTLL